MILAYSSRKAEIDTGKKYILCYYFETIPINLEIFNVIFAPKISFRNYTITFLKTKVVHF